MRFLGSAFFSNRTFAHPTFYGFFFKKNPCKIRQTRVHPRFEVYATQPESRFAKVLFKKIGCTLALGAIAVAAQASAVVQGVFKNTQPGTRVEVYVPHFYVDNLSDTYRTEFNVQGKFSVAVDLVEPQLVFLVLGEESLPVFVEPNDTIIVRADFFQFPFGVSFAGRSGANNRFWQSCRPFFWQDANEFNNIRYKVGQWWFGLEMTVNDTMLALAPTEFRAWADRSRNSAWVAYEDFDRQSPGELTSAFRQWFEAEVVYSWAYHLLMYGSVFRNRYQIDEASFFEFLHYAPTISEALGSESYRQFLLALMARRQGKKDDPERYFVGQYETATQTLSGRSLAFFQSEIIRMAFSSERYREVLSAYRQFLEGNEYPIFEGKITPLYERTIRVLPGTAAPEFRAHDALTGRSVGLSDLRGKVVYLNFWATWCGACLKKMEVFNALAPELEAADIQIVNVSIDDNSDAWRTLLAERQFVGYQLLASGSGAQNNIARVFEVEAVPQYFIIARDGTFAEKPYSSQPLDIQKRLLELVR
jgi:peroxiredoxin